MRHRPPIRDQLTKHWLLIAILLCIILASIYPKLGSKRGPLYTEYSVKYGAVTLIFLISGFTLKTDKILETVQQHRLHIFIQVFTFVLIPLYTKFLTILLGLLNIDQWVLKGLITVACMPPPVSSAVILTKAANGNETAAIFNSILGSFLGIVITPLLLLLNLGMTTMLPLSSTLIQLITTVLLPLVIGQLLRNRTNFRHHNLPLNTVSQIALLYVIYTTFCDTFDGTDAVLGPAEVLLTLLTVVFMQITLMTIAFYAAQLFKTDFDAQDAVAIVFCSTHKSLTLGIPILRLMFYGYAHLTSITLPLLMYHPTQIILGGLVVAQFKEWTMKKRKRRHPI